MKKFLVLITASCFLFACSNNASKPETNNSSTASNEASKPAESSSETKPNPSYDPNRGVGKFTHIDVGAKLDQSMATAGKGIYDVKCAGCHKLTTEKLVGPGWSGVTKRYHPEWIMNFVTNTDEMLNSDPKAQAQLEICLVRMPNQNLSDDDARHLVEFMRQNDGVK